ncbi:MAG: phospholipase [Anaerolineaceae bacterium]|nr:phospholipase [Anaerolineaceae bacterium]
MNNIHQNQAVLTRGVPLEEAEQVVILLHGRGATAESILILADYLPAKNTTYLAPQAGQQRWYPFSFMAPFENNQPDLNQALARVQELVNHVLENGIPVEKIWLAGFSQGACLAAEFVAQNPRRYAGLLVFSGGRIGPPETKWPPVSGLENLPVFIGCSDVDPHIPVERVHETDAFFQQSAASVLTKIYPNMGHTISDEELTDALTVFTG